MGGAIPPITRKGAYMIKGFYWTDRKEKTISERYGSFILSVRYMANSNVAQVSMSDISKFKYPLIWSCTMSDSQANGAIQLFNQIGFFDMPVQ